MSLEPATLEGRFVRLEPLQLHHANDLYEASQDQRIWAYMPLNPSGSLEAMNALIENALREQQKGTLLPFAIVDSATGRAVGSTRYLDIRLADRGLEIGWTWLTPTVQRTGVNTECKYLLLRHAFESLHMIRVQLKTDSRNLKSQQAIERIGGKREGVLRNHMILPNSYIRHSVYYSIIDSEWPDVKAILEEKMTAYL
ncbi:MAG TPA: GNAT family N-acetyltransferase [Ktedonobacter sp.]|nr:GNAT family N-acetyltransferase [Ktedonobacter sp.]